MRFGTFLPQGWKGDLDGVPVEDQWPRILSHAALVEEAGFDSLWVYDHFHTHPVVRQESTFEAWTLLAAIAPATRRVRLGQMCTCALYRPPALLAKLASSVDVISGGRLDVGIGAGWSKGEFEAYGYEFPSAGQRLDMLEETVRIMKEMWTQDEASFAGKHHSITGAVNRPKPIQKPYPNLWIAGGGERRTLRIVAEHADFANFQAGLDVFRHKSSVLAEHCQAIGRPFEEIGRTHHLMAVIGVDEADLDTKVGIAARRRSSTTEEFRSEHLAATVSEATDVMGQFADAGCVEMIVYFYDTGEGDSLELFASEVIPQIR